MNKEHIIEMINNGIIATNTKDVYSCGMRNGMRWCKSLLDDKAPEFEDASHCTQPKTIRCKDCMHRPIKKDGYIVPPGPEYDDEKCPFLCDDPFYSRIPGDNFFCADGERREE